MSRFRASLITALVLALVALATACNHTGGTQAAPASDLYAYPDTARGVVCYRVSMESGLSCVIIPPKTAEATR